MTHADIARQYRKKYGADKPTLALARIMYGENKLTFKNVDAARKALRYIEGKLGAGNKKAVKDTEFFKEEARPYNPYKLPQPDSDDLKPYVLPKAWDDFIFASDFHIPNHRQEPITAMLDYAKMHGIKKLMIGGDLLDNTPFTRWSREPLNRDDVKRWFDMATDFLKVMKSHFDDIIFIEGNHDAWYKRFLLQKAQELFDDPYYDLENRLGLHQLGIKFIPQEYLVKAGKLNIHHGHITFRGGGSYANAARMLYMKTKANMLCGHVHVSTSHTEPDINDVICTTFTVGCMSTLRPDYQPFGGRACHGFARVRVEPNRNFRVDNIRIYEGKIL